MMPRLRETPAPCRPAALVLAAALVAALVPLAAPAAEDAPADPVLAARAFRAAAARVLPSVVTIETYGGAAAPPPPPPQERTPPGAPGRPAPRRRAGALANPGEGPTTGLIISSDGYIITSTFNFLRSPPVITVVLGDGSRHVARLCGRDETRGLCLLAIEGAAGLPAAQHAPPDGLRVGQWVLSVGVGYGGDEPAISAGIVSALGRLSGKAVQTDANLSPANYGGPLVDLEGRVVGVCVCLYPRGGSAGEGVQWYDSGVGFAIPLADAGPVLERLKAGEVIRPGRLGVRPARGASGPGVTVESVLPDSPAQKAGIQAKDVIVALGEQPVRDVMVLRALIGACAAGDTVTLRFKRGGEERAVPVTLDAGDEGLPAPPEPPSIDRGGPGRAFSMRAGAAPPHRRDQQPAQFRRRTP
ncbi:MAG: PDZ domain-containing protein [Planctomycetes bacterium]|nr:PDZ domain-containing protein [Planctomycetota bacterium]